MLKITKEIKQSILKLETVDERLSFIKNKYQDKTAIVILTGPTLNDHNHKEMKEIFNKREDLVILSVKQAYNITLDSTDFHILNPWNIDRKNPTEYIDNNTITL